jgi:hypothetical protein
MLKATSRLTTIMAAEQQKRNIVIVGMNSQQCWLSSSSLADYYKVAVSLAQQPHISCRTIQSLISKTIPLPSLKPPRLQAAHPEKRADYLVSGLIRHVLYH